MKELLSLMTATCSGERDERLEGFQCLQRSFEAQRSRLNAVFLRSLRHDRANQVVRQQVSPDFLANQLRSLASDDIHLHRRFEWI